MEPWVLTLIIAVIGSSALSSLITGIFTERAAKKREQSATQAGVKWLLYAKIKELGTQYIDRGSITVEELEDLKKMHKIYHDGLKGNGFLDALMHQIELLPIKAA